MKKSLSTLIWLILILFYGCRCTEVNCPAFNTNHVNWISKSIADTVKYINATGSTLNFIINDRQTSEAYKEDCHPNGYLGCYCGTCRTSGSISSISDSSRNGGHSLHINFSADENYGHRMDYTILDYNNYFYFDKKTSEYTTDTTMAHQILGSTIYYDVTIQKLDTTLAEYASTSIWKAYCNKEYGVIGFWDRQTQSLFYLK